MSNRAIIGELTETTAVDSYTSVIVEEGLRVVVTTVAGGPSPEEWWRRLRERERQERLERAAAGRLETMAPGELAELARAALGGGSGGGGWRLMRWLRHCQQQPPAAWPPEIRLPVLKTLVRRMS